MLATAYKEMALSKPCKQRNSKFYLNHVTGIVSYYLSRNAVYPRLTTPGWMLLHVANEIMV